MAGLEALKGTLSELKKFRAEAVYKRSQQLLEGEIARVELELSKTKPAAEPQQVSKRCVTVLSEHAFDESERFVKIYIPHKCLEIADDNVQLEMTSNSVKVTIKDEHKDYEFQVVSLLKPIDVAKSYKKVKSDDQMVALYLKKAKEGEKWGFLTLTEKHLKDVKTKPLDEEKGEKDPMGGLMDIMKKMYDSGDAEMKRTIAKAWTEGQDKKRMD